MELVRATFTRNAMNYNLYLSILLQGSRGVGKFSIIKKVAQHLGIHLMAVSDYPMHMVCKPFNISQLNCFEITGDTEIKTEATLKFRFEQAISCAPCILVLRHIEALANVGDDADSKNDGVPKVVGSVMITFNFKQDQNGRGYCKNVLRRLLDIGMLLDTPS